MVARAEGNGTATPVWELHVFPFFAEWPRLQGGSQDESQRTPSEGTRSVPLADSILVRYILVSRRA